MNWFQLLTQKDWEQINAHINSKLEPFFAQTRIDSEKRWIEFQDEQRSNWEFNQDKNRELIESGIDHIRRQMLESHKAVESVENERLIKALDALSEAANSLEKYLSGVK